MTQETKKIAKNKREWNIMLGDKLLILTAIGVATFETFQYFYLNPQAAKLREAQKIARIYSVNNEPNIYEPNAYEPNNLENKTENTNNLKIK